MDPKHFRVKLNDKAHTNNYYRKVIYTDANQQIVLMSLSVDEYIPEEVHPTTSQFIHVQSGNATIKLGRKRVYLRDGDALVIPPGLTHSVRNSGGCDLQLYTIYSPPEHPPGLKQRTMEDALRQHHESTGQ